MIDLSLARAGDQQSIEDIITECSPMLKGLCRQFFLTGLDSDDLMQEAMLGLLQAIKSFDMDKNDNFKSYAYICAQRKLLSVYRAQFRQKSRLSNSTLGIDSEGAILKGDESGLIVVISDQDFVTDFADREQDKARNMALQSLLKPTDYVILQKYLSGYKYNEIAELMHISSKSVDNRIQAIKKILLKNKDKIIKGE